MVTSGDRVFIPGGAGGVGTLAIQLAKWMGTEVATTASSRGETLVRELGADHVIDYTRQRFKDVLRDYDATLDLIGGHASPTASPSSNGAPRPFPSPEFPSRRRRAVTWSAARG